MRFVSIYRPSKFHAPTPKMMEEMGKFMAEAIAKGVLLATEGFGPSSPQDLKVRLTGGEVRVTDGPFTEAKEVIGGFALMKCSSREEMLEWTRRFMAIAGDGECEIHQLSEQSPIEMFGGHGVPCNQAS
jgi:hypothetical protein